MLARVSVDWWILEQEVMSAVGEGGRMKVWRCAASAPVGEATRELFIVAIHKRIVERIKRRLKIALMHS